MELIKDKIFRTIANEVSQNLDRSNFPDDLSFSYYCKYILLENHQEKFKDTPLNIYYNKYHFFLSYSIYKQKLNGYDAGLEQQEFKILETGEEYSSIDWSVIEQISNDIKNAINPQK